MQRVDAPEPKWDLTRYRRPDLCTELFLAEAGIERMMGLERFTVLEVLWLNDNRFRSLRFLEHVPRLKSLYAHNNSISSFEGALKNCRFIEILTLQNNKIRDLRAVTEQLEHLKYLTELNLFGNPVAEESHYRETLIYKIPTLKILDRHVVSDEERRKCVAFFEGDVKKTVAFGRKMPDKPLSSPVGLSIVEKELDSYVTKLKKQAEILQEEERRKMREEAEREAMEQMRLRPPPLPKALNFLEATRPKTMPPVLAKGGQDSVSPSRTRFFVKKLEPPRVDDMMDIPGFTAGAAAEVATTSTSTIQLNPRMYRSFNELAQLKNQRNLEPHIYTM